METWNVQALVGEGPFWDRETQSLFWIDIRAPALHRFSGEGDALARWDLAEPIGAFALLADGRAAVVALKSGLAILDLESGRTRPLMDPEPDRPENRLNEGKVSPCGRYFVFGSMDDRPEKTATGALYCLSAEGDLSCLARELVVANGVAWSPDGGTIYFSDSRASVIWAADWSAGTIANRRVFARPSAAEGRPDGAAMDDDGCYWSAGVSAGYLNRFSPSGELVERIALPVRAPTMPAFGGARRDRLFVTSHRAIDRPGEDDGKIVVLEPGRSGPDQRRFLMRSP